MRGHHNSDNRTPLAFGVAASDLDEMKTQLVTQRDPAPQPKAEDPLRLFVVPELLGQDHQVIREPDDTDEDYAARCALFALIVEAAGDVSLVSLP